MLFLVDNRLLHLQQSVVDGDVKCAVLIERNPRIVGKMHANLPVVPTRRHYEVVLELTTVTVKGSVDARIQTGINHLRIVSGHGHANAPDHSPGGNWSCPSAVRLRVES